MPRDGLAGLVPQHNDGHQTNISQNPVLHLTGTKNPPIAYGMTLEWCLVWIYNLHIGHQHKDKLMLSDDILTAFHQIFYHPCMMQCLHGSSALMCIPARSIFGSCSSPGFYMFVDKLRAWAAGAINFQSMCTHLMLQMVFPPDPTCNEVADFFQAIPDAFNPRAATLTSHGASTLCPVFDDDISNANT